MGEVTKIEWCDHTFNPWIGCTKVSPGCAHCYAARQNEHWKWVEGWGPGTPRRITSEANWRQLRKWNDKAILASERRRVFVASLADVFDGEAPAGARERLWAEIDACPNLEFLLLTKRPENWEAMLPADWLAAWRLMFGLGSLPKINRGGMSVATLQWNFGSAIVPRHSL